jgi:hypothetical protein
MAEYEDDTLINVTMSSPIERTEMGQTKEELEMLFPGVLTKVYTQDTYALNDIITIKAVKVHDPKTFSVDVDIEMKLNKTATFLEESMLSTGHSDLVDELFQTHEPIRAKFLDTVGVQVLWQKKKSLP